MRHQRRPSWVLFALLLLAGMPAQAQVLISQVYGGGGNTGATIKQDFIELFNAGTTSVSLSGWSVQYASATGTTWQVTNLSGSLAPGQYFLVQEAAGSSVTAIPLANPDVVGTIAMSGTAGKVALRNSTVALSGACPTASDLVAFGTTASCNTPTGNLSNTTAALRKGNGCTNTSVNNADFDIGAPAPRNSLSSTNACGAVLPSDPTASAVFAPSAVQVGENTQLRVTVAPGQNPLSTGLVVIANLSAIGGAADQALFDDGSNGDSVAGDNVFTVNTAVAAGTTTGGKSIGIGVGDAQLRSASLSTTLSVVQLIGIHDLQGAGLASPFAGQSVVVEGLVTARKSNGFFLQTADGQEDGNAATSEGVFVFTSAAPSASATVGNRVRVLGNVVEFKSSSNPHQLTITEITAPVISVLGSGNALPLPVTITDALANAAGPIDNLERLEGMRVAVPALDVVAPVGANISEASALSPADGVFFGVVQGVARPFREPGIGALDTTVIPGGISPPVFDTNPERIRVQSTGQSGAGVIAVDVGDLVTGLAGVLDYGFGAYSLLPDPAAAYSITAGATPTAVSVAKGSEITIGGFNLQRFFDETDAAGTSDVKLTAATVANRLKKTTNAICAYVRTPDILGVVEVENLDILSRLATSINNGDSLFPGSCATNPGYVAYLEEGNDVGGIDVGFLVSSAEVRPGVPRVEVLEIIQAGKDALLQNPDGSTSLLNDRPSLALRARINQANGASYDVTVVSNHLRSLSGVNSVELRTDGWVTEGGRVRGKRAAQAAYLAEWIHARQLANPGEKIVLLGDFNAFEFNDGYTDSMGVITGREAAPGEVLVHVDSPITTPLTNLADLSPAADRYSFSFDGNAQSLDHMVVNQALLDATAGVRAEHARINADFGEDNYGDFTVPVRVSDHDPVVLFLDESTFASVDLAASVVASDASVVIGQTVGFGIAVQNGGPDAAAPVSLKMSLNAAIAGLQVQVASGWNCGAPAIAGATTTVQCSIASLASGEQASFTVLAPTSQELGGRTLTLDAQVSSPMTDLAPANNNASASTQVTASANLVATVLAPKGPLSTKKTALFGVGVGNFGPHAARNAVLSIAVNAPKAVVAAIQATGLNCVNATDTPAMSTWHCTTVEFYRAGRFDGVALTVNPLYSQGGSISIGASFSSQTTDPNPGNNTASAAVRVNGQTVTIQ